MGRIIISYQQCKAARDLLDWSRNDLCKKANIGTTTLADFERGARNLRIESLEKVLCAFKEAGIIFKEDDNETGVSLLKKNCE